MGPAGGSVVQDIRFARSSDGVQIAYAVHGSGPPLLVDSCWLSHLPFDWQSPVWWHYLVELGQIATVVRFDERGHGLSDRGVTDHSLAARVADLEAVADDAGLEQSAVLAMAQGGPVAIEYVARHPERVTRLAFYGGYAHAHAHADASAEALELDAAFTALIKVGWDRPTPEFRRVFTSLMIPGGTEEQMRWFDDLQRMAVDATTAVLAREQRQVTDASARLPELDLPVLVMHSRGDQMNEFASSRHLATHIRGARLVALDSENHIVLAHEPAWRTLMDELTAFLELERERVAPQQASAQVKAPEVARLLSPRELDVLRLEARGGTTTPSARSWCCRSVPSSGTCRTRTPSSACTVPPPGPPRSRACCRAPEPYASAPSQRRTCEREVRVGADAEESSDP